jgi:REP element-mobilizing transposase RayT
MKHYAGQYYHIYNRGVAHQPIFLKKDNYLFLLRSIIEFLPDYHLSFIAYCLMPNHYHFLIRVNGDDQLSPFLQRLFNRYTQALNKQQNRTGTLFESRAQYRLVDTNEYVLQLARYIHLNPVRAGLVSHPQDWEFSNYREWAGTRNGVLVDMEFVKSFFPKPQEYEAFVLADLSEEIEQKVAGYVIE